MSTRTPGPAEEAVAPDEAAVTAEFVAFLKAASVERQKKNPGEPIRRFNQGRGAGCVEAEFVVPDLPATLRVGLFAQPRTYRAFIRFANGTSADDSEKDVRGMSIAVFDVPGENLTGGQARQDFVLNSHPVMVAPDAKEFMALLRAMEAGRARAALYFLTHPHLLRIALASRRHHASHLQVDYWSATPYLFGQGRAVKYVVRPTDGAADDRTGRLPKTYLTDALRSHLARRDASFDFLVQFQKDPARMPIEDATVEWKSEAVAVARIRIPPQAVEGDLRAQACEQMVFNPWHCLAEHRPLGGMNRARREIYTALSQFRLGAATAPASRG